MIIIVFVFIWYSREWSWWDWCRKKVVIFMNLILHLYGSGGDVWAYLISILNGSVVVNSKGWHIMLSALAITKNRVLLQSRARYLAVLCVPKDQIAGCAWWLWLLVSHSWIGDVLLWRKWVNKGIADNDNCQEIINRWWTAMSMWKRVVYIYISII